MNQIGACQLHVPHKDWSADPKEKQNYEAIEQWSYRLKKCYGLQTTTTVRTPTVLSSRGVHHAYWFRWSAPVYPAPPTSNNIYVDFNSLSSSNSTTGDEGTLFTPDTSGNLHVTVGGIIMWNGFVEALSAPTSITGQSYFLFSMGGFPSQSGDQRNILPLQGTKIWLGGGSFTPYNDWSLQIGLQNWNVPPNIPVSIQMDLNVIEIF